MKNQVIIVLDTEAPIPLQIGKMESEPPSPEKIKETILLDFSTVSEAVIVLIEELHRMGIQPAQTSIHALITAIEEEFPGTFSVE